MVKVGLYHDYDLRANEHIKGEPICIVCGKPLACRWTDYHGEGACLTCGTPYQILHYDENNKRLDLPPACSVRDKTIPYLRQYWQQFHRPMDLGWYMDGPPDFMALVDCHAWLKAHMPRDLYEGRTV